jgi:Fe-S oxidoreductase
MAKLKVELEHQHHQENGPSRRDRLFANVDTVSAVGSALAPLPALLQRLPGSGLLGEKLLGIARERSLPTFERETLVDWAESREPQVGADADHRVLLFPDTYTNYSHPAVGRAAVALLEAAGVHVRIVDEVTASGRAAHSKGLLDVARKRARENIEALAPKLDDWDLVVPEPSDAVMFQSDYLDLLDGEEVRTVAANTYGLCEYLDRHRLDEQVEFDAPDTSLIYHGHCHQKATKRDHHAVAVLRRAGYAVDALDSGCCGMAGSFGYEAEHYSMSQEIADILREQIARSEGGVVVTPGASCRSQLTDQARGSDDLAWTDAEAPPHPVEALATAVADGGAPDE